MFQHSLNQGLTRRVVFHWFLLTFLAGSINAGGYLACHRFVSHVTGFATLAGIDFAEGKIDGALGILSVPLFFLFGVMISAYLIDRRVEQGKRPAYPSVMALVALCLILVTAAGSFDMFSGFGERVRLKQDFFFLALLCMASGLQNAAITTSSGATVRTTHLTGLTTDLGIGIVRMLSRKKGDRVHEATRQANLLRAGTIVSFIAGSFAGALLFLRVGYAGFLLPAGLAIYAMFEARAKVNGPGRDRPSPLETSL